MGPWAREPLRLGAAALLLGLAAGGHDLWVYTTSYRGPRAVRWWLRGHGVRLGGVVNQDQHDRRVGRRGPSKDPARFGIDLHVDDSWGVWLENHRGAGVCVVRPDDPDWADRVRDAVARVARNRRPAAPPDLPEAYRHLAG